MKDKTKLLVMKTAGALFVAGIILFLAMITLDEIGSGTLTPMFAIVFLPAIAIIAILVIMIKQQSKGVKKGLPMHDEMSTRIKHSAGYYSYIITIYFLLAVMWYHMLIEELSLPPILPEHIAFSTMAFMFAIFCVAYLIIKRRGIK